MSVDRRHFLEIAGLAGAGLLASCGKQETPAPAKTASAAPAAASPARAPVTLKLTLWGSALYAFAKNGSQVEVAFLTKDPGDTAGCMFVPHHPLLEFPVGAAKLGAGSTLKLGTDNALPEGVYRIDASSLPGGYPPLKPVGLLDDPQGCVTDASKMTSLGYVATLAAKSPSGIDPRWRDRFGTRLILATGDIQAHAPLHGASDVAEWDVTGPDGVVRSYPLTDTLQLTLQLAGSSLTLVNEKNETVVIETDADPTTIEMRLLAHPVSSAPAPGPEPHMCALYTVFSPHPKESERAQFKFKSWCPVKGGGAAPSNPKGPSPGKYCTGAKVLV